MFTMLGMPYFEVKHVIRLLHLVMYLVTYVVSVGFNSTRNWVRLKQKNVDNIIFIILNPVMPLSTYVIRHKPNSIMSFYMFNYT